MTTYSIDESSLRQAVEDMAADWASASLLYGERSKAAESAYYRVCGAVDIYKGITGKMAILSLDGSVNFYERR